MATPIADFAVKQNAFNDQQDAAIVDITTEIATLNSTIAALQASTGTITADDQALLDSIQTRAAAITAKLKALDTLTPPTPPSA